MMKKVKKSGLPSLLILLLGFIVKTGKLDSKVFMTYANTTCESENFTQKKIDLFISKNASEYSNS